MNQVAEKKSAGLPANMFEDDAAKGLGAIGQEDLCLLYTSPSPRDVEESRMPSSA